MKIYIIGSLRDGDDNTTPNPRVLAVSKALREDGYEVFDNWMAAGPDADNRWRDYHKQKGHSFIQALDDYDSHHVFQFDKRHLDSCTHAILVCPAGKSAHMEVMYARLTGKKTYILLDNPDRWDFMYQFIVPEGQSAATVIFENLEGLLGQLHKERTLDTSAGREDGLPTRPGIWWEDVYTGERGFVGKLDSRDANRPGSQQTEAAAVSGNACNPDYCYTCQGPCRRATDDDSTFQFRGDS